MRNLLSVLLTLLCLSAAAQGRWQWLNPRPSGAINTRLLFTDTLTGYLFNDGGELLRTTDGARSWSVLRRFDGGTDMGLVEGRLVVTDWKRVHVSDDTGASWRSVAVESDPAYGLAGVDAVSRDSLFVYSDNPNTGYSYLYRSWDGGRSWQKLGLPVAGVQRMDFVDSKTGFVGGWNGLYRTKDGGQSWQKVHTSSGVYTAVQFYNARVGFAHHEWDTMLRTVDGGETWTAVNVNGRIQSIFFVDSLTAFAAGEDGAAYRTTDGGATWEWAGADGLTYRTTIYALYFFDAHTGFSTGHRGRILETGDGGRSWKAHAPTDNNVLALQLVNDSLGYATTWDGLFRTGNRGATWEHVPFDANNERMRFVRFRGRDTGLVINAKAGVYRTTNGGSTWTRIPLPYNFDSYHGCTFVDSVGYLSVSNWGRYSMLRTTDWGATWTEVANHYPQFYSNLHFVDAQTGFATLTSGVYRTTDSARTWTRVHQSQYQYFNSIHFIDSRTGYAAGDGGYLVKTTDGGGTWRQIRMDDMFASDNILAVRFFNEQVGYALRKSGQVMQTIDNGRTWQPHGRPTYFDRHLVAMTADSMIYIAGEYGALLKRSIADFNVDGLAVGSLTACSAQVSASVQAVLSTVDSLWFEWGVERFTDTVVSMPGSVTNGRVAVAQVLKNLAPNTTYRLRVKLLFKGQYHYSDEIAFTTKPLPKPVITVGTTTLVSSSAGGNQWYLNGVAIAGANGQVVSLAAPGLYTVQVTAQGCVSPMSDAYSHVATAISDPVLERGVAVFPNPVRDNLYVVNREGRRLVVEVYDGTGRRVRVLQARGGTTAVDMRSAPAGVYRVVVRDESTGGIMVRGVVKG